MAWTSIPNINVGSLVRANDIGQWFTTITSQARTINDTHCSSNNSRYYSSHRSSVNTSNNGIWNSDSSVGQHHGRKCGGSITLG